MRTLREIANEVRTNWKNVSPYAEQYLSAMATLNNVTDRYIFDDGRDIVLRFLCNANGWRGEVARRVKAELKSML